MIVCTRVSQPASRIVRGVRSRWRAKARYVLPAIVSEMRPPKSRLARNHLKYSRSVRLPSSMPSCSE
jgi:hypothetical protein